MKSKKEEANRLMQKFEELHAEIDQWNKDAGLFRVTFEDDFDKVLKTIGDQVGISR